MYVSPQLFLPPARGDKIARKTEEQKRETTRKSCENEEVVKRLTKCRHVLTDPTGIVSNERHLGVCVASRFTAHSQC